MIRQQATNIINAMTVQCVARNSLLISYMINWCSFIGRVRFLGDNISEVCEREREREPYATASCTSIAPNVVLQKVRVKMREMETLRMAHGWTLTQRCLVYQCVGM